MHMIPMERWDFTLKIYSNFLSSLCFLPFYRFLDFRTTPKEKAIILRHDVDRIPLHSLRFAQMQYSLGIQGTYYFRVVSESMNPNVIELIAGLGHEIGYHYEDVSLAAASLKAEKYQIKYPEVFQERLLERAIESFATNLAVMRRYADIRTICMHGSPLSPWDSRLLWTKYNYRDFGLIGEPYFDIDFNKVAYYTDTGRRWDGDRSVVRDKPWPSSLTVKSASEVSLQPGEKPPSQSQSFPTYHSTIDIIKAAKEGTLPERVMFTFHPQRWHDRWLPWTRELVWQNCKNAAKYGLGQWRGRRDR